MSVSEQTVLRQQLFKNTSILLISQILGWGLTLVITLYLPRYLGVANIGKYQLAVSLWSTVIILATFGMDTYLTREIAQDHSRVDLLLSQSLVAKITFFIMGTGLLTIYISFTHYERDTIQVITILGIANLINVLSSGFGATIQGLERVAYLGLVGIITNILSTSACLIAIYFHATLITIAWITTAGSILTLIFYLVLLNRIYRFHFIFSFYNIRPFLLTSISFFLLQIFINLYQQVDVIVISWIVNEKGVGWYGVASRLTNSLMFIPTIFMTVFFPTFSRLHSESPQELIILFRKAFHLIFLLGVGVSMGMFVLAYPVIQLIYGAEFAHSAPILSVRSLVAISTFLNTIIGMYLIVINRQKRWIWVMAIATAATIPLDLILVPFCQRFFDNGALGGAYSFLVTELGMTIVGILFLPPKTLGWDTLWYSFRTLLAGSGMVASIWWLRYYFIAVPIIVGAVIFLILTILLKLVNKEEWLIVKGFLSSLIVRLQKRPVRRMNEI